MPRQTDPPARPAPGRRVVVISGPSGSGKSTICRRLIERDRRFWLSVSATSRPPRPGEVEGRDYIFLTPQQFERDIAAGRFLEYAEVFGHYYGTPRAPLERALARGRWVLLDIDVNGAKQVRRVYPEAVLIFIVAPSREVLEARLKGRGTDPPEVVARRLAAAEEELKQRHFYDHVVVNDRLEEAVETICRIVFGEEAERDRPRRQPASPPDPGNSGGSA